MNDNDVIEGKLVAVEPDSLMVETITTGGTIGLSYEHANIKSVEVKLAAGEQLDIPQEPEIDEVQIEEDVLEENIPVEAEQPAETSDEVLNETIEEVEAGTPEQVEELIDEGAAEQELNPVAPASASQN